MNGINAGRNVQDAWTRKLGQRFTAKQVVAAIMGAIVEPVMISEAEPATVSPYPTGGDGISVGLNHLFHHSVIFRQDEPEMDSFPGRFPHGGSESGHLAA